MPLTESASSALKAAIESGVIADSEPPVTTASTSPGLDHHLGRADRVRAARAGGDDAVAGAEQLVAHRHRGRGGVAHHERDRQRRDLLGAALDQQFLAALERADATDAGAQDRGDPSPS